VIYRALPGGSDIIVLYYCLMATWTGLGDNTKLFWAVLSHGRGARDASPGPPALVSRRGAHPSFTVFPPASDPASRSGAAPTPWCSLCGLPLGAIFSQRHGIDLHRRLAYNGAEARRQSLGARAPVVLLRDDDAVVARLRWGVFYKTVADGLRTGVVRALIMIFADD
jgi:hypothetical protein